MLKLLKQRYYRNPVQGIGNRKAAGFTLIEMLVILAIIAALTVIVAPSWSAFVTQRRVNLIQEQVSRSIQDAKQQAQVRQIPYTVSFRSVNGVLQVAVLPAGVNPFLSPLTTAANVWRPLATGEVRPRQVVMASNMNLTTYTTVGATVNANQTPPASTTTINSGTAPLGDGSVPLGAITFDNRGILPETSRPPINITVAAPLRTNPNQPTPRSRRCIIIDTLLGGVRSDRDANCLTW